MRITMVAACPFPCSRGTPIRVYRLAEALHRRGHDIRVVTYHFGEADPVAPFPVVRIPRVPFYHRFSAGPTMAKLLVLDPLLCWTLRRVLRADPPDLVHAHHYEGFLSATLAATDETPVVFDVHTLLEGELPVYAPSLPARLKRWTGAALDDVVPPLASHIVTVSEEIKERLRDRHDVGPEGVTVIPSGVEDRLFEPPDHGNRPGMEDVRNVVYTGSFAPFQNIELLLEAFARVRSRRSDVRLHLLSKSSFAPFEKRARRLGIEDAVRVVRGGYPELPGFLAGADVAVNPRVQCDGVPQKLLNYMACGMPIVSFAGYAGYLTDEVSALTVRPGDVGGLERAICRLLDDPGLAARLGEAARERASRHFRWSAAAGRLEQLYRRLLSDRAGGAKTATSSSVSLGSRSGGGPRIRDHLRPRRVSAVWAPTRGNDESGPRGGADEDGREESRAT